MLKQELQQKLQQKLSPQQIQVIRMLELNAIELEERIKQELIDNPALDEGVENSATPDDSYEPESNSLEDGGNVTAEEISLGDYRNDDDIPDYRLEADNFSNREKRTDIPFGDTNSFHDMLLEQLALRELTPEEELIGEYIIGNIDDSGYLLRPLTAVSDDLIFQAGVDATPERIEEILQTIQDFDPAGVAASNLQECLILQIERKEATPTTMLAFKILSEMFDEFTKKHYDKIQKQYNLSQEELREAIHEITTLTPKPGNSYSDSFSEGMSHIIPDFIVDVSDGVISMSLNNSHIPELRISSTYTDMLADYTGNKQNQTAQNRDALLFIKQKLDAAQWFVDAIKQRQQTLIATMQVILNRQQPFFLTGDEKMLRPMILKDVAEQAGYDISTISRVCNRKYVLTSFGIFSLKHFFSESMQNEQGEEVSSREIKQLLKEIIESESKQKPLADDKLCELLKEKGYVIARRTVAKYREQLGIPVARLRKEI